MASGPTDRQLGRALLLAPPTASRIARFVLTAWLLALGGIWAAQQLHAGLHEHLELAPAVHVIRDASLAVPLAALALAAGGLVTAELAGWARLGPGTAAGRAMFAVVAALAFAALSIPGVQMHALLFGAEAEEIGWLADALLDGGVVLLASLAVLLPATILRLAPWPPDNREPTTVRASLVALPE